MEPRVESILKELTLEEKAGLCSGADIWNLKSVERLGLKTIMVADGPHGLRKQFDTADVSGLTPSAKATCFPTACASACSWDLDLLNEIGQAIGEECLQEQVSVVLGPGVNIKRSPLCGRNFEYFSEDPYLAGKLAASFINGVQSKGIGTSLKHFALNNQETLRMTIDAVADERAKREIYLKPFEIAVKESQPWTVMCSYNRVDGTYASDHKRLLTDILKDEWGHQGVVISDWGATNDRVRGIDAGMEIEMPASQEKNDERIVAAVQNGSLDIEALDHAVRRILSLILKSTDNFKEDYHYNQSAHHSLARKAAAASTVLLKNNGILPLKKDKNIAVIGAFAKTPRYQGAGSSLINPHQVDSACDELEKQNIPYAFAPGYAFNETEPNDTLIQEAVALAKYSDTVVLFAGLPDAFESEGFDRTHISMPESHNTLIRQILNVCQNTVIVLMNGSAVSMPWEQGASAILACHLGGEAVASAAVDVLFGRINPCGKLAETYPFALEDVPSYLYFPGFKESVEYRESIYVGYRYYDKAEKTVLYPFGHGLSYTEFTYRAFSIDEKNGNFHLSFTLKNTGKYDGAEIVQVYVQNNDSVLFKPEKELRDFKKVFLKAGEETIVTFTLTKDAFTYYNTEISNWHIESGIYKILIGSSSRDIRLNQAVAIKSNIIALVPDERRRLPDYYSFEEDVFTVSSAQFELLYGQPLPVREYTEKQPFHMNTRLSQIKNTLVGKVFYAIVNSIVKKMAKENGTDTDTDSTYRMTINTLNQMPIRALGLFGGDMIPKYTAEALVFMLNKKLIKGIKLLLKK